MRIALVVGMVAAVGLLLLTSSCSTASDETATIHTPEWSPPTLGQVTVELQDLGFSEFVEDSYRLYLLRHPQALTHRGVAVEFGVRHDRLDDYSEAYLEETRAIERLILDGLRSYNRAELSSEQQVTYDVCEWYWDDIVRAQEFADYDYLISHYYITSRDWAIYDLLVEVHPFTRLEDVEDFVARLAAIEPQFDQLIAALGKRAEKGLLPAKLILRQAVSNLQGLTYAPAARHPYLNELVAGMDTISTLTDTQKEAFRAQAIEILESQVSPAYHRLYDKLRDLEDAAPDAIGYGALPGGAAYYDYALRHQNQTLLTADEIHEMGLAQVARISQQMRDAADELGYPEDLSIASIYSRVVQDGGSIPASEVVSTYEDLLAAAEVAVLEVIERVPSSQVEVVGAPQGGYYRPSSGYQPAQFVASVGGLQPYYSMPTLTYHETIPGHHLQIALASALDLPRLRRTEVFLGYTEGWALYSERLAWELGWYEGDPYGNLGRLSDEMMRAVRLVVDTGIHTKGWTFSEAVSYFAENTGRPLSFARGQVLRYLVWPGQSTAYMIGQLKLLELRELAQTTLGNDFDLKSFHSLILDSGSLPLEILEQRVRSAVGLDDPA